MDIKSSKPVSIPFAKKYLSGLKLKEETATYEQMQAIEYVKKFSKVDAKKAEKLVKTLLSEVPQLDEETAIKIVDIMPSKPDTVRAICAMNKRPIDDSDLQKIVDLIHGK